LSKRFAKGHLQESLWLKGSLNFLNIKSKTLNSYLIVIKSVWSSCLQLIKFIMFCGPFGTIDFLTGATPKSVLELMNVKDLTLAHVKSHLQVGT
jgi:SHAQKYF class myb-like DNA-binding protein